MAGLSRRPFTSAHSPAPRSASWATGLRVPPRAGPPSRRAAATVSEIAIVGNGFGRWKTNPVAGGAAAERRAGGEVVEDRHRRKGMGAREDHPEGGADRHNINVVAIERGVIEQDLSLDTTARNLLVHPVDRAHERRLAAAGRADDGGDLVGREVEVDAPHRLVVAVKALQAAQRDGVALDALGHRWPALLGWRGRGRWVCLLCARFGLFHVDHAVRLLRERMRAGIVSRRIRTISASAAPQARSTRRSWAWRTSFQICSGSEFIGLPRS